MEEKKNVKKEDNKPKKQTNAKDKINNKSKTESKKTKTTASKKSVETSNAKSKATKTTTTSKKTTETVSKAKKNNVNNPKPKKIVEKKKVDEDVDIAFIENEEEIEVEELDNSNLLIDQEALEEKQLEAIKDVIKKNKKEKKSKASKQAKYKKVLKNILLGIALTIYFLILVVGKAVVPTIEYITCLKITTIVEIIISIIIFEISYKKDKEELFLHGFEMMTVAAATLLYLHFFSMQDNKLNIIGAVIIGIVDVYYLIKTIIIALRKDNKNNK